MALTIYTVVHIRKTTVHHLKLFTMPYDISNFETVISLNFKIRGR